jgi:hypothetical protein
MNLNHDSLIFFLNFVASIYLTVFFYPYSPHIHDTKPSLELLSFTLCCH